MLEILPYDQNWPLEFRTIASTLRSGLGEIALRIDHIGSTSVTALPAMEDFFREVTKLNAMPPQEPQL